MCERVVYLSISLSLYLSISLSLYLSFWTPYGAHMKLIRPGPCAYVYFWVQAGAHMELIRSGPCTYVYFWTPYGVAHEIDSVRAMYLRIFLGAGRGRS